MERYTKGYKRSNWIFIAPMRFTSRMIYAAIGTPRNFYAAHLFTPRAAGVLFRIVQNPNTPSAKTIFQIGKEFGS